MRILSNLKIKIWIILIIPVIYFIYYLIQMHFTGPFYLSRIDPEYPYLLNGLNCAILHFERIGHTDHPGTPFQMLTGLFIRITWWFSGKGSIIDDVISRPEVYLTWASLYLALLTTLVIIWLGKTALKLTGSITDMVVLQSSFFLNTILLEMSMRYDPDRILAVYVLILVILCLKLFYQEDFSERKYAIYSGILLGIGFITKFNFLPVLLIPPLLIRKNKERGVYLIALVSSAFISFLPIRKKFTDYRRFITKIAEHDGLYGSGSKHFINIDYFITNLGTIIKQNISTVILIGAALVLVIILFIKSSLREKNRKEFAFLAAFVAISLIGVAMVAKHYKNSYVVPFVTLGGFAYMIITKTIAPFIKIKNKNLIILFLFLIMIYFPFGKMIRYLPVRARTLANREFTAHFVESHITKNDYFFIEPTWISGPMLENGLVFGFSYVAGHNLYYNNVERYYPNLLTWEGENAAMKYTRMIDADNEAVLKSGKNIYILSTPGRNAPKLCDYIEKNAKEFGVKMRKDTCFSDINDHEYIFKYTNENGWKTTLSVNCGFEKEYHGSVLTDNGIMQLKGSFDQVKGTTCNGVYAIKLDSTKRESPAYIVQNVKKGDYLEFTIKRTLKNDSEKKNGGLVLYAKDGSSDSLFAQTSTHQSLKIKPGWILTRLSADIKEQPHDGKVVCYFRYNGDRTVYLDDFTCKHFSNYPMDREEN